MRLFAYIVYDVKPSGGNAIIFEHVNRFHQNGYPVVVISVRGGRPNWIKTNVRILTFWQAIFMKFDFIVCTFWPTVYVSKLLRTSNRYYFVQGWEADFYHNPLLRSLVLRTFHMVQMVVTSSLYLVKLIKPYANVVYKVEYVEINKRVFHPHPQKVVKTRPQILSVISRYHYAKGPDLYDEAAMLLTRAGYDLTLVSFEKIPPTSAPIRFISNPSLRQLAQLYRKADFLLVTSRNEGYYLPGLEAMASGCVLLSTPCGGIDEYAKHRKNAIMFSPKQMDELPRILDSIWKDKLLYRKLQKQGLETVKKHNWDRIIDQLERIYRLDR